MFCIDKFRKTSSNKQLNKREIMLVLLSVLKAKEKYSENSANAREKIILNFLRKECGNLDINDRDLLELYDGMSALSPEAIMDLVYQYCGKKCSEKSADRLLDELWGNFPDEFNVLVNRIEDFSGDFYKWLKEFESDITSLTMVCEDPLAYNILKFVFEGCTNVSLLHTNITRDDFPHSQKFDTIVSNIYNYRVYDTGVTVQRVEYKYVLQKLISVLNPNMYNLLCHLPYNFISDEKNREYRNHLEETLKVESIWFPEEYSVANSDVMVLFSYWDRNRVYIYNGDAEEKKLSRDEFRRLPNWRFESFFDLSKDDHSSMMVSLKSCARVFRGKNIGASELSDRGQKESDSAFYVIGLSEFDEAGIEINFGNDRYISFYNINPEFQLKKGDVLLSARGTVLKSIVFEDDFNFRCISTSGMVVIRTNEELLNPYYLECLLHTSTIKERLSNISRTVCKISLTVEDVENFEIPLLKMDLQEEIAAEYIAAKKKMLEAQKELKDCISNMQRRLDDRAF